MASSLSLKMWPKKFQKVLTTKLSFVRTGKSPISTEVSETQMKSIGY